MQGLTVADNGTVSILSNNPEEVVTHFIEQFRDLSSPLVKKTMQPLLSAIEPTGQSTQITQTETKPEEKQENGKKE